MLQKEATRKEYLPIALILLLTLFVRLYRLGTLPGGLNADELFNAIDAWRIGVEHWPIFFEGNNGREAFFLYAMAASLRLFGQTIFAMRLTAALMGTGSAWLAYYLGNQHVNRRVGLLAAALISVSLWPLMESRWGLRGVSLTFMSALTVTLFDAAFRHRESRRWLWVLSGASLGLTIYTYIPSRTMPIVILVWFGWLFWAQRAGAILQWRNMLLSLFVGLLLFLPFGVYITQFPEKVNQRVGGLNVALDAATERGDFAPLGESLLGVARMFSFNGDVEWRYHVSGDPVFDPLTSLFFYVGLVVCVWLAFSRKWSGTKRPFYALLLLWMGAMLTPNAILEANSSFLRAAGAIVPIYLMTAIGFDRMASWLNGRFPKVISPFTINLFVIGGILLTLTSTHHRYVNIWNNQDDVRRIYQIDMMEVAFFLDEQQPPANTRVYLADSYVVDMAPKAFEYYSDYRVDWFAAANSFALGNGNRPLWVFETINEKIPAEFVEKLGLETAVSTYPFGNGDDAFNLYKIDLAADDWLPQHQLYVDFEQLPRLIGYDLPDEIYLGETIPIFLHWQILPEQINLPNQLTFVKVKLEDGSGNVWSESENLLGYPQQSWQAGDRFVQLLRLAVPEGMLPGNARLQVTMRDVVGEPISIVGVNSVATAVNKTDPFIVRSSPLLDFTPSPDMLIFDETMVLRKALFSTNLMPGLDIDIGLDWVALKRPLVDYQVQFQLIYAGEAAPFLTQTDSIWPDVYPPTEWQEGEAVRSLHRLNIPADVPMGDNPELHILLIDPEGETAVSITQGGDKLADLTPIFRPHQFDVPSISQPLNAQFGDAIQLLGYDLDQSSLSENDIVRLTLYWQAIETPSDHYTVFNHIINTDGQIQGQLDAPPVGGAWLTGSWLPGEVVVDRREIVLGDGGVNGRYVLITGLYNSSSGERLPVILNGELQSGDQLILSEIEIKR